MIRNVRLKDWPTSGTITIFGVLLGLSLFAVLFPWFPGQRSIREGSVASSSIVAPRDHTYDSVVKTEIRRTEAAAAVPNVLVLDPGIRDYQLDLLNQQLSDIEAVRRNPSLSSSARESELRDVQGVSISRVSATVLADATDAEWGALTEELRSALERTLTVAINEEHVRTSRNRLRGMLSPLLSSDQAVALHELADPLVVANQIVDEERTADLREQAMAAQPVVQVTVVSGQVIVQEGQLLSGADIEQLDELELRETGVRAPKLLSTMLLASIAAAACSGYVFVTRPPSLGSFRRLALFALLLLIPAAVAKFTFPLLILDGERLFLAYAVPLAAAPIAAVVLLDVGIALLLTIVLAGIASFIAVYLPADEMVSAAGQAESTRMWIVVTAGSLAGVYFVARTDRLQRYLATGISVATALALALMIFWLLESERRAIELLWIYGAAFVGGLLSALIAVGTIVLLSRPFGIITRWELMELAQFNHRLLRRLQDEAPGTFQHSVLVGNLAEHAADRIGANSLLVRVGAYYHDIGKLTAPEFFVENSVTDDDPHQALDPLQSTRVIHRHVSGGIELARRERLPEAVVQFIPQHHGTRPVVFFYRRAASTDADIDFEQFRYPGPKPQTREAALVMLADACEAIVRSSTDRSAPKISEIVEGVVSERIEEGELDECDISLRDLRVIASSFSSSLTAVYHPRVEYPDPTDHEIERRGHTPLSGTGRDSQDNEPSDKTLRVSPGEASLHPPTEDDA